MRMCILATEFHGNRILLETSVYLQSAMPIVLVRNACYNKETEGVQLYRRLAMHR